MDWDDLVAKHIPGFHMYDEFADKRVTLRDLVSHKTGVPRNDILWIAKLGGLNRTRDEIASSLKYFLPNLDFRTQFQVGG